MSYSWDDYNITLKEDEYHFKFSEMTLKDMETSDSYITSIGLKIIKAAGHRVLHALEDDVRKIPIRIIAVLNEMRVYCNDGNVRWLKCRKHIVSEDKNFIIYKRLNS